jgi:hypothetical protein
MGVDIPAATGTFRPVPADGVDGSGAPAAARGTVWHPGRIAHSIVLGTSAGVRPKERAMSHRWVIGQRATGQRATVHRVIGQRGTGSRAVEPRAGRRRGRSRSPLFTTWHVLRRHIDLCRTSAAMCCPTH